MAKQKYSDERLDGLSESQYDEIYGPELNKDNCDPETWEAIGGNTEEVSDDELPF